MLAPSEAIFSLASVSGTCFTPTRIFTARSFLARVGSALVLAQEQRGVGPTETEGIVQRSPHGHASRAVRHGIQIALGVRRLLIDRRRHVPVAQCERHDRRFETA